ncbi:hypothetical protein ACHAWF_008017, partial [Thalassiosira exigua]
PPPSSIPTPDPILLLIHHHLASFCGIGSLPPPPYRPIAMRLPPPSLPLLASAPFASGGVASVAAFRSPPVGSRRPVVPTALEAEAAPPPSVQVRRVRGLRLPALGRFNKKSPPSKPTPDGSDRRISNQRILALATTTCLTLLLRPSASHATSTTSVALAGFVDPSTLTCDEVPCLGSPASDAIVLKSLLLLASAIAGSAAVAGGTLFVACAYLVTSVVAKSVHGNVAAFATALRLAGVGAKDEKKAAWLESRRTPGAKKTHWFRAAHGNVAALIASLRTAGLGAEDEKKAAWTEGRRGGDEHGSRTEKYRGWIAPIGDEREGAQGGRLKIMENLVAWDDYKRLVDELQDRKSEVDDLKRENAQLESLLRIERSILRATPISEGLEVTPEAEPVKGDEGAGIDEELDAIEAMGREYEEAVEDALARTRGRARKEAAEAEDPCAVRSEDLGSGIR